MNVKYFYEFKGSDKVLNRVEILTDETTESKEVTPSGRPFTLSYKDRGKLAPVCDCGATLSFISKEIFQFVDLHTDDMQQYLVKFYRGGNLFWIGWLDSELYNERLTDYPPYEVEFTASDFNIFYRLKYRDSGGSSYTDIATLFDHLRRCLNLLNLPFNKLYLGCSTTMDNGGSGRGQENAFTTSYIMSSNFYDEDGEPMSCREVIESLLQPFGLTMLQKDANVYIVDYNTIHDGLSMRRYDFNTFSFETTESVSWDNGDIKGKLFSSSNAYGFEEMYNNVTITSSLYAEDTAIDKSVSEDTVSNEITSDNQGMYSMTEYSTCEGWSHNLFAVWEDFNSGNTVVGAVMNYTGNGTERNGITFESDDMYLFTEDSCWIRIKCSAYANTKDNPFDDEDSDYPESTRRLRLFCKLLLLQGNNVVSYCKDRRWYDVSSESEAEYCELTFFTSSGQQGALDIRVVNQWVTNSRNGRGSSEVDTTVQLDRFLQNGDLFMSPSKSGKLKLVIDYAIIDDNKREFGGAQATVFKDVKDLLINDISITLEDDDGNRLSTDDYEFKSYINKKVNNDYDAVTLRCISANEEKYPIGKANMLFKNGNNYGIQTSFTRAGQTDILERLLMCTIHSNYSDKNEKFGCLVKMNGNPILGHINYSSMLQGTYLVTGCSLDFRNAQTTLSCVGYSDDTALLSDIPYD